MKSEASRLSLCLKSKTAADTSFARPETLNDPLECSIQEIAEKNIMECCEQEKKEQLEGFVLAYVMTNEYGLMWGLPKNKVKQVLSKIGDVKDFDGKYRIFADFIKSRTGNYPSNPASKYMYITDILRNVGIFSLSETCDNELMWGHYADGGNGIAIGFQIQDKSSITSNSLCLKVNYTNDPLVLKDTVPSFASVWTRTNMLICSAVIPQGRFQTPPALCRLSPRCRRQPAQADKRSADIHTACFARPTPRLTAVVVFPTPPFWFVRAITLQFDIGASSFRIDLATLSRWLCKQYQRTQKSRLLLKSIRISGSVICLRYIRFSFSWSVHL